MKIRNGFVSNSSSSSFILTSNRGSYDKALEELKGYIKLKKKWGATGVCITLPIKKGNHCFGRQFMTYRNLADRLNFATCILLEEEIYGRDWKKHSDMKDIFEGALEKAVKEVTKMDDFYVDMNFDYNTMYYNSINDKKLEIDHQSNEEDNKTMFKDVDTLYDFLFNDESAVYNGSDEEYPTFEYEEGARKYKEIYGKFPWCCSKDEFEFDGKELIQKHEYEYSPLDDCTMLWHCYGDYELDEYEKRSLRRWKKKSHPFLDRLEKEGKLKSFDEWCKKEYGR